MVTVIILGHLFLNKTITQIFWIEMYPDNISTAFFPFRRGDQRLDQVTRTEEGGLSKSGMPTETCARLWSSALTMSF